MTSGGVACIRGLRIPVATVVGMIADGMTEPEILVAYPDLEAEDVREALRYAAEALFLVRGHGLPLGNDHRTLTDSRRSKVRAASRLRRSPARSGRRRRDRIPSDRRYARLRWSGRGEVRPVVSA